MTIALSDWKNFILDGIRPDCSSEILEFWEQCKNKSLIMDLNNLPRLNKEKLSEIKNNIHIDAAVDLLDNIVNNAKPNINGFFLFADTEYNVLYMSSFSEEMPCLLGCNLSEQYIGNISTNMSLRLKKPVYCSRYEHINKCFHDYVGYSEPIYSEEGMLGVFTVYMKDFLEDGERLFLSNMARIINGCFKCSVNNITAVVKRRNNSGFEAKGSFRDIVYRSKTIEKAIHKAKLFSKSNHAIIIYGESGAGKELFAQAIHNSSSRSRGPFVSLNCATLSDSLLVSELFGYVEGAFTGANRKGKKGKFELADGGTIFLDEIGDLSFSAQAAILRVLQEKEFIRIGDERVTTTDFRLICATNSNLQELCLEKRFRWDLYYRLCGMDLIIPSLRERREDIVVLAKHCLYNLNEKGKDKKQFSPEAVQMLEQYLWPGNVRELFSIIEAAWFLSDERQMIKRDTIAELLGHYHISKADDYNSKKKKLLDALNQSGGKISLAAQRLNISRSTAYRWLNEINAK